MMKRAATFIGVMAIALGTASAGFTLKSSLADTGTVVGGGLSVQGQWGACIWWDIKGSDGIVRTYTMAKSDPDYDFAKNLILYSMTTGSIYFDVSGTACGNPRLNGLWIGQ